MIIGNSHLYDRTPATQYDPPLTTKDKAQPKILQKAGIILIKVLRLLQPNLMLPIDVAPPKKAQITWKLLQHIKPEEESHRDSH